MRILIPGGHGFVGKNVVEILKDAEHEIFPLSRREGLDLTAYDLAKKYFSEIRPAVIINCAAHVGSLHYVTQYAADVVDDNMQMILNLYRAVKESCPEAKVINPISNCSYPGDANIHIESEWWNGPVHDSVLSYGNTRRLIYVISKCYEMQHNIKTVNFLVPNSYGPGDYTDPNKTHALNGMIIRMLNAKKERRREFEIWGTGKPTREWIYVRDLAKMLRNAVDFEESLMYPINIAQNRAYSIREIAEMIRELVGYGGKLVFNTNYPDGAPTKILDDRLFRQRFPEFQFTNIHKGIKETIEYYKSKLGVEQ